MMMTTKMKCALFVNQLLRGVRLVSNIRVMNLQLSLENGECSQERDRLHHWSFLSIICYIVFTSIMFLTLSMISMDTANMPFIYSAFRHGFRVRIVIIQLVRLVGRSGSLVQREQ